MDLVGPGSVLEGFRSRMVEAAASTQLAPRSVFVLAGEARATWLNRLLPVRAERRSFTVRAPAAPADP